MMTAPTAQSRTSQAGKPLLGLCPIGKFVFSHDEAIRQKIALQNRLRKMHVPFVDLDKTLPDGLVREQTHVAAAVDHFRRAGVRCLFLPHCNFGTEGAAAMIARELDLPTLLWGPRDEAPQPDGTRLRDTLCGLLATSKVLRRLGVRFSYIPNVPVEDQTLAEGIDRFLRAVAVAEVFTGGVRIGHLGQRIDFFWTTIINEGELLERFGMEILPIDMPETLRKIDNQAARSDYADEIASLRESADIEDLDNAALGRLLAYRDTLMDLAEEYQLDALAVQDFSSLSDHLGAWSFHAGAMVAENIPVGFESDIHGAISDLLLRRASFNRQPAWLTDITTRHPDNDNAVLLWHAGAPLSLKATDARVRIGRHWILPQGHSGMGHYPLKAGPITLARFDGDNGRYVLATGQGHSTPGPETLNNYVWMQVDDWPRWERTLIDGPFIHHAAMIYEPLAEVLLEAGNFIPDLELLRLDEPQK